MRQLGDRYVESNRGASYKMRGYDPRPILVIEPPPGATGPRFRSLTFTEAVASLPTHFTDEDLLQIFLVAGGSNRDRLWNGLQTTFCSIQEQRLVVTILFINNRCIY